MEAFAVDAEGAMLVSQDWTETHLGTDRKGVAKLIRRGMLKRHPLTGSFLKSQVEGVREQIAKELLYGDDGAALGRQEPKMGMQSGFRQEPNLV